MRIILLFSLVFLSGCAPVKLLYDSYTLGRFDNQEYRYTVEIRTAAELSAAECGDAQASKANARDIHRLAQSFYNYSRALPNNTDATDIARGFVSLTTGFEERYTKTTVSETFCRTKFGLIARAAESAQQVIARKPR